MFCNKNVLQTALYTYFCDVPFKGDIAKTNVGKPFSSSYLIHWESTRNLRNSPAGKCFVQLTGALYLPYRLKGKTTCEVQHVFQHLSSVAPLLSQTFFYVLCHLNEPTYFLEMR